jgi:hypothetical protein
MKIIALILVLALTACSDAPEQEVEVDVKPHTMSKDNVFKGYKDNLQKAKDMEKEVLKAAEKQKKAIDG